MIRLYNDSSYFNKNEIIIDNEAFFKNNVSARNFSENSLAVMLDIDNAKLLDKKTGKIETPYGIAGVTDLSTGCKTVLNYIFMAENPAVYPIVKAINATECGWNALEKLFVHMEQYNDSRQIAVVIEHDNELFRCSDRDYLVNGKRYIKSMYDFY